MRPARKSRASKLRTLFEREYFGLEAGPRMIGDRTLLAEGEGGQHSLSATVEWGGTRHGLHGEGIGPIDAFVGALSELIGVSLRVGDYQEHALGDGAAATAVAYVELVLGPGQHLYGAGVAPSIVDASLRAVLSAVGRAVMRGWIAAPGDGIAGGGPSQRR